MQIQWLPIASVIPYEKNPRKNAKAVPEVVKSITEFGWQQPLVVDKEMVLIVGHTRLLAAKQMGLSEVPVIIAANLTPAQARAYRIKDNRSAQHAEWDMTYLHDEFDAVVAMNEKFDLEWLGFDDTWKREVVAAENPDEDTVPEVKESRCKVGDLWQLGKHRLLCGDSTNIDNVQRLIGEAKIDLVYTDPPYGINEKTDRVAHSLTFTKGSSRGVAKKGQYSKIIGDDSIQTAVDVFNLIETLDIKTVVYWGGNYYANALPNSACWIVWDKRVDDSQRDINSDCELAWVKHPHKKSVRIFRHLWKGMIKGSEHGESRIHPTQKPIALAEWSFSELDPKGTTVLDLFLGSGSTLIACEKAGKQCFGMELDPAYCDSILGRWESYAGKKAVLLDNLPSV